MWEPSQYQLSVEIFLRLMGVVYFFFFWPFIFQIKGLLGSNGILPIDRYLSAIKATFGKRSYRLVPSLLWIHCSDPALLALVWTGVGCSLLLAFGICPPLMIFLLYMLHLSIVSTGQEFLSFGWDIFLLELACNSFLLSLTAIPNPLVWFSINFLLFRFHLQSGAVKLQSKDPTWKNLTALAFHYQTQPLPNTIAWFIHKLPLSFHKYSTVLMFFIELIVPFGIFGPQWMRLTVFILFAGLQCLIWLTGNFAYLNLMTLVFTTLLIADSYLTFILGMPDVPLPVPLMLDLFLYLAGAILIILQSMNLWEHFSHTSNVYFRKLFRSLTPFHLINRYGIFAVMTTKRYEIVIEGSLDGIEWKEYLFKYKPSEIDRRPRRISPYHPRLDWQMWFLPFSSFENNVWLQNFLFQLLDGEKEVVALLRESPFDTPPQFIRAIVYDYQFSSWDVLKRSGQWWERKYVCAYSPIFEREKG